MVKRSLDLFKRQDPESQNEQGGSIILTNYNPQYPQDVADYPNKDSILLLGEGNPDIGMVFFFK